MWETIQSWLNGLGNYALSSIVPALIIVAVGAVCIRVILKVFTAAMKRTKVERTAYGLMRSVVKAVLSLLLCLMVASRVGIDVTGIVALASVLSLAVSLSVQDALANLIGGFTLLSTKPFVAGDFVEVGGQSGTVEEIGLAYTKLTTPDNKMVSIPNSAVVASEVVNYTTTGSRRVDIKVSASYDDSVDLVLEALKEAAQVPTRLQDKEPFVAVNSYGDNAIEYLLLVWSATPDFGTTKFAVQKRIKEVFDEKGISMTYPHLNVHLDK